MESGNCHPDFKHLQREVRFIRDQINRINKQPNRLDERVDRSNRCNNRIVTEKRDSKEYFDICNERWASEVRARLSEIKELRKENHKLKSQIQNGIYTMRCAKCCKVLCDEIPGWYTKPDGFQYCDECEM